MTYLEKATKSTPTAPVITIVGSPGVGKTTLAAKFPAPIFIQCEKASTVFEGSPAEAQPTFLPEIPRSNIKRDVRSSDIIKAQLRELATEKHEFKTIVIDSITSMNSLLEHEIVEYDPGNVSSVADAAGGFHKGFQVLASMHQDIRIACEHLRNSGMAIILLAHSGIIKMKNRPDSGEYTAFSIDMHEKSRNFYVNNSDAVLYIKQSEIVTGAETDKRGKQTKPGRIRNTGERTIIASSDGTVGYIDAKNRYNMPGEIELTPDDNPVLQYIPFLTLNR